MLNPEHSTINFIEHLQDMTSLDPSKVNLLIIDDLMHEMNDVVTKLLRKAVTTHWNTSVLLRTQNIFHQNKHYRTVSLNAHHIILLKDVRDASQITNLSNQMYSGDVKYMRSSCEDATNKHYGYRSYNKVEVSSLCCWVQSFRSLHHYILIRNNHGSEYSVRKRNYSQDT